MGNPRPRLLIYLDPSALLAEYTTQDNRCTGLSILTPSNAARANALMALAVILDLLEHELEHGPILSAALSRVGFVIQNNAPYMDPAAMEAEFTFSLTPSSIWLTKDKEELWISGPGEPYQLLYSVAYAMLRYDMDPEAAIHHLNLACLNRITPCQN